MPISLLANRRYTLYLVSRISLMISTQMLSVAVGWHLYEITGQSSPNDTLVRGGTYYSFQPGNGVREYAAELGLRYYREQRAALAVGRPTSKISRFKCGPPANARAWAVLRDELFAGVDVVPPC